MNFQSEALMIEILGLLQEQQKLLREILARLPTPQTFHPVSAPRSSITVHS
jgi:hypothetical protein